MRWVSVVSEESRASSAINECVHKVRESGEQPDIAFLFPSQHHAPEYETLSAALARGLGPRHVLGCSAGGVIAGGQEVEHKPALGLVCAWMPGVEIHGFHVEQENMPSPDARPAAWRSWIGFEQAGEKPCLLLLSDPFSLNPEDMVSGLDFALPGSVKVGGLASGARQPGGNALFLDAKTFRSGAVGAVFTGDVQLDPIVAQGCRPIGRPMQVTRCDRNLLLEIDGQPTLAALERLLESLTDQDRRLARTSLFLGLLNDPMKSDADKKDYLIRNLIGLDPERNILAIGALLRPGQTIQFHLRDKRTSAQDLEERLKGYVASHPGARPEGALLFSCLGRGQHLYQRPNYDSDAFASELGPLPLGGFFCNGEIGPVDGTTYVHGYTSCFGLFLPKK